MEEFKNGAITEEALDEIAGGLGMPKLTVKNVLIAAGIGVLAVGAGFGGSVGMKYYNKLQKEKKKPKVKAAVPQKNPKNKQEDVPQSKPFNSYITEDDLIRYPEIHPEFF